MAAKKKGLRRALALVEATAVPDRYEALVNGIAASITPIIQEGFRRAMGFALANAGQVANGTALAQGLIVENTMDFAPGTVLDGTKCKVEGCSNPTRCKGLCSKHYQGARRRAELRTTGKVARKPARSTRVKRIFDQLTEGTVRRPRSARKANAKKITNRKAPRAARPGKTAAPAAPESKAAA